MNVKDKKYLEMDLLMFMRFGHLKIFEKRSSLRYVISATYEYHRGLNKTVQDFIFKNVIALLRIVPFSLSLNHYLPQIEAK